MCEENIGEVVEQEDKSCDVVKTVRDFGYHGSRVSVDGRCEAALTVRTRCDGLILGSVVSCCVV